MNTKQDETPAVISPKRYKCERCGHEETHKTNHYGPTWSLGHYATCPKCPPWAKYPEFGGNTTWICMDTPPNKESFGDWLKQGNDAIDDPGGNIIPSRVQANHDQYDNERHPFQ